MRGIRLQFSNFLVNHHGREFFCGKGSESFRLHKRMIICVLSLVPYLLAIQEFRYAKLGLFIDAVGGRLTQRGGFGSEPLPPAGTSPIPVGQGKSRGELNLSGGQSSPPQNGIFSRRVAMVWVTLAEAMSGRMAISRGSGVVVIG